MFEVMEINDEFWHWFFNKQKKIPIKGKYLFFSPSTQKLREVALYCIKAFSEKIWQAKFSIEPNESGDCVLCVYTEQNDMQDTMIEVANKFDVRIPIRRDGSVGNFWKTNKDTLSGIYYCKTHKEYHTLGENCIT